MRRDLKILEMQEEAKREASCWTLNALKAVKHESHPKGRPDTWTIMVAFNVVKHLSSPVVGELDRKEHC